MDELKVLLEQAVAITIDGKGGTYLPDMPLHKFRAHINRALQHCDSEDEVKPPRVITTPPPGPADTTLVPRVYAVPVELDLAYREALQSNSRSQIEAVRIAFRAERAKLLRLPEGPPPGHHKVQECLSNLSARYKRVYNT